MSARPISGSRSATASASNPSPVNSTAIFCALAKVRFHILIRLIGRTAAWARARKSAIAPAPMTSSRDESSRDR
jgi:hypothetical protein